MDDLSFATWFLLCLAEAAGMWGFWLAGAWYARRALSPSSGDGAGQSDHALGLLTTGLGWALGLGLRGLVASWGYYVGASPLVSIFACGLAGTVLVFLLRNQRHLLLSSGALRKPSLSTKVCLGLFVCSILIHLARVPLPWYDQDEISAYGFLTRVIAQGWTFSEVVEIWTGTVHFGPKLVECLDAQLFLLAGDIWIVRLSRVAGLVATGLICAGTLGALGAPLAYAWAVACTVLTTPELLAYLGVSLKVDAVVMLPETGALCVLALAWLSHLPGKSGAHGVEGRARHETARRRAELAFILALFTAASRQSGLYATILCGASLLWFSWPWREGAPRGLWRRLALLAFAGFFAGVGYWANWAVFGNPIYPFKAPWPLSAAPYLLTLEGARQQFNLLGPPGLVQLYLIPHLALGLEVRNLPVPPYTAFPHAVSRGQSMGWLSPALFAIFLWPLALRLRPALVLGALFLAQYVLWCQGIYYTRLFLGPSMLMAVLCGYLCWAEPLPGHRSGPALRWAARILLVLTLALTLPLGVRWSWMRFTNHPQSWFTSQGRFEYASRVMSLNSGGLPMPSRTDTARMDAVLATLDRPVVGVLSHDGNGMHMLFARGFFVAGKLTPTPDALLLGPNNSVASVPESMRLAYISTDGAWRLYVQDKTFPGAR